MLIETDQDPDEAAARNDLANMPGPRVVEKVSLDDIYYPAYVAMIATRHLAEKAELFAEKDRIG